jgi:magnesium transporter
MHRDFTTVQLNQTVGEALASLRQHPPPGRIIYFYVVDAENRLHGVVPTRRLILHEMKTPIAEIMVSHVISLPARATVLEACEFFIQHRLLALPVVDEDRKLLGVVDMELYTSEIGQLSEGQNREALFQLIGVRMTEAQHANPVLAFRKRFPWLGANLAGGILAAWLAELFQDQLSRAVALAFFIPVVLNLAESVSTQSVSLSLHALDVSSSSGRATLRKLGRELITGLLLGIGSGAVMAAIAFVWLRQSAVASCLLGGISGGVAGAALLGCGIPLLLRRLHLEPRVASGPVALAGTDVWTIFLYLALARWLIP